MAELNVERVRMWVRALRRGIFTQSTGHLRSDKGMCCLGVACELALINGAGVLVDYREGDSIWAYGSVHSTFDTAYMPYPVVDWYGFDSSNPFLKVPLQVWQRHFDRRSVERGSDWFRDVLPCDLERPDLQGDDLNDSWSFTFDEIADCVEFTFLPDDWAARQAADAAQS